MLRFKFYFRQTSEARLGSEALTAIMADLIIPECSAGKCQLSLWLTYTPRITVLFQAF